MLVAGGYRPRHELLCTPPHTVVFWCRNFSGLQDAVLVNSSRGESVWACQKMVQPPPTAASRRWQKLVLTAYDDGA